MKKPIFLITAAVVLLCGRNDDKSHTSVTEDSQQSAIKNYADTMKQAAAFDHVCAAYKQNYRSIDIFLKADCLPIDCDNDHSDDPADWLTLFDVAMDFPGVGMIFVYGRNHMKQKSKCGPETRLLIS